MRPDTEKWLALSPVEALLCRDLRHAWPRPPGTPERRRRRGGARAAVPPSSQNIVWKVVAAGTDTGPRVLERTMLCTAGCGVRRVEVFVVRTGGLVRTGRAKMRYPAGYRRTRDDPDQPLEPLDTDVLRGSIVHRLYPGVQW